MEWWEAILLGLVQGVCEFLPVSSSGHLILIERWLGLHSDMMFFNVAVHFATLLSVTIALREQVWAVVRHPTGPVARLIVISFLPTAALALLFQFLLPDLVEGACLAVGFAGTACVLAATALFSGRGIKPAAAMSARDALIAGAAQGIAVLPGLSRSGTTIAALTLRGVERKEAVRFSFLMSIPVILASMAFELLSFRPEQIEWLPYLLAFVTALASGYLAVRFMIRLFSEKATWPFAVYMAGMAVLTLLTA